MAGKYARNGGLAVLAAGVVAVVSPVFTLGGTTGRRPAAAKSTGQHATVEPESFGFVDSIIRDPKENLDGIGILEPTVPVPVALGHFSTSDEIKLGYTQASAIDLEQGCEASLVGSGSDLMAAEHNILECVDEHLRSDDNIGSTTTGGDAVIRRLDQLCAPAFQLATPSDIQESANEFYACIAGGTGPNTDIQYFVQAMKAAHLDRPTLPPRVWRKTSGSNCADVPIVRCSLGVADGFAP
jgi:hypothetical protein